MSEESRTRDPLEMLRRSVEAGSRRDFDEALAPFSPDGVWDMSPLGMGVFKGHEAIRGFFEDWIRAYEDYEIALDEIHDLGNGVTFGVLVQRGRPAGSVGFVELRYATISTWADGLVERSTHYTDIDEARAAAERSARERG
jgi:ketosteroid isomerase-like protein